MRRRQLTALLRSVLPLSLAILVSACGFQLRGTAQALDHTYSSIRLQDKSGDIIFQRALEQALRDAGVRISLDSSYILTITRTHLKKRTASYSSRAKSAEYELTKDVSFQFKQEKNTLIPRTSLQTRRSYLYRETVAVGKAEEERLLRTEMDQDLAQRILLSLQRSIRESNQ